MKTSIETIQGLVEKVIFHNSENGYTIINLTLQEGKKDSVIVVGSSASIAAGEHIKAQGNWFQDKRYGMQFKADIITIVPPNSLEGIEKYLASGLVKGIGPVYATKLITAFGLDIFNVIENHPEKLAKVPGIGKTRAKQIISGWKEQKAVRDIILFVHAYDIPTSQAIKIFKQYGADAIRIIQENPYKLAKDIHGIGFKTSDTIALKIGIDRHAKFRVQAGIFYCLNLALEQSSCSMHLDLLLKNAIELLQIEETYVEQALDKLLSEGDLVLEEINNNPCIFLKQLFDAETFIADKLKDLAQGTLPWGMVDAAESIQYAQNTLDIELSKTQKIAVEEALKNKLLVITGGPGVGKTTIVNSILKILQAEGVNVGLAAPTGRAAKRIFETTGHEAKTLHRLLQKNIGQSQYNNNVFMLECDLLIVDEVSMMDVPLMFSLLKALPQQTALLLVGDVDQLPSVGPGTVLSDIIKSNIIPVIRLTEIFRQASASKIIANAYKVNSGLMPNLVNENADQSDFFFIESSTPESALEKIIALVSKNIPSRFGICPIRDVQILSPMNKGLLGTKNLNAVMQKTLNAHHTKSINILGNTFSVGDKIMQITNNYDKEVYNGDIGLIYSIDQEKEEVAIYFDTKLLVYDFVELSDIVLAYAVTIHKSQGSEYHTVIIPVVTEHFIMLQRNLLYTAITRGKKLVILVGQRKAVDIALEKKSETRRNSSLYKKLTSSE